MGIIRAKKGNEYILLSIDKEGEIKEVDVVDTMPTTPNSSTLYILKGKTSLSDSNIWTGTSTEFAALPKGELNSGTLYIITDD